MISCAVSAAPNREVSLRYTKQNTQVVILAAPGFWVLGFAICIAVPAKLTLFGEKKKTRRKKTFIMLYQSETHVGHRQVQNMFSLLLRHPEVTESVAPTAVYQSLCQPYTYHPPLFLLFLLSTPAPISGEEPPHIPCSCDNNPMARL